MKPTKNKKPAPSLVVEFDAGDKVTIRLTKDVASLMNKATQGNVPYGWISKMFNDGMRKRLASHAGKLESTNP